MIAVDTSHMIAVDTSAIMAVLLGESTAPDIIEIMADNDLFMSAGTLSELLIVAGSRGVGEEAKAIIRKLGIEIVPVDGLAAEAVEAAYMKWGKGRNPAGLNFGDCFAYAAAQEHDAPLLFVGEDFRKTDVTVVY